MNHYKTIFRLITKIDLMKSIIDQSYYLILNQIIFNDLIIYYWLIYNYFTNQINQIQRLIFHYQDIFINHLPILLSCKNYFHHINYYQLQNHFKKSLHLLYHYSHATFQQIIFQFYICCIFIHSLVQIYTSLLKLPLNIILMVLEISNFEYQIIVFVSLNWFIFLIDLY